MKKRLLCCVLVLVSMARAADEALPPANAPAGARAGGARPAPAPVTPTPEQLQAIQTKLAELKTAIQALKDAKANDELVVDAEAIAWVVENITRVPGGFISQEVLNRCLPLLGDGLRRASEIKSGTARWPQLKGRVNRAYRSSVDGTAQPYHLTIPASYDPSKPIPLYVYLHGRSPHDPDLGHTWVGGSDRLGENAAGRNNSYIRVEAFGRGNNSFRWAGETDVLEVIAAIQERYNIDPNRILLAGFSMGGAGAWQIGLRMPDLFCGLEINAGVIGNRLKTDDLTPVQRASTIPYGMMVDHALAVANIPLVGFAGENDSQLAASVNVREQLGREGFEIEQSSQHVWRGNDINALFLVNPAQGHAHPTGETLRLRDEFTSANFARGRVVPDRVRFVTYSTRYNRNHWVTVDGLQQHFSRSTVDATRDADKKNFTVTTSNISRLLLTDTNAAERVTIDGEVLRVKPAANILFARNGTRWQTANPARASSALRKQHKLQGPINDAFLESFLCVSPTGQAFNAIAAQRAKLEQERFAKMFARDFSGETRTKNDVLVTSQDIANNNLVLFGDPGSNKVLARIAGKLPIKWTKDSIVFGGKTYSAAEHVPVLIYPNPLNPKRYVVINTGLTPQGRGATSFGDYAVLKVVTQPDGQQTTVIADEGLFDEAWQISSQKI